VQTPSLVFNTVVIDYDFLQPHLPHLQTSQEQVLPSQLGHLQSVHPHSATFVASLAGALQQDFAGEPLVFAAPASHAQLPQVQVSHEQTSPLQLGHAQSTQPQPALAVLDEASCPAKASA
jgi:hypothetical protein